MAKDSSRITAGELQKKVESRGQKNFKKIIKHHHMLFGRASRKKSRKENAFTENNLQHIQLSDTTGTSNGTGFYGQM